MSLKEVIKYILLGAIQGFFEPLPVSSSAHMAIFANYANISSNDLNVEIIMNFASFLAISWFLYRKNKHKTIPSYYKDSKIKYLLLLIIATIPAGILGLLFKDIIDSYLKSMLLIGIFLLCTSIILLLISYLIKLCNNEEKPITFLDALFIGLAQGVAILPGVSRSGITLSMGIVRKKSVNTALDFSFRMYQIISLATMVLAVPDLINNGLNISIYYLIICFITCFIISFFSIKWFYQIISSFTLKIFALYTFILSLFLIINNLG